jgi:predicted nucleotidyltransferase
MFKDFFIKTVHQKMLSFLSTHASKTFHERELVRKTGIAAGSANRVLNELFMAGILKREKRGKMYFYSLDESDPTVRQFKVLNTILSLDPLVKKLKSWTNTLILYGSSSQGTDDYQSDVDLLVVTSAEEKIRKIVNKFKFPREIKMVLKSPSEWLELESQDQVFYNEVSRGIILWEKPINESRL